MKKIIFIAPHLSTGGLPQYLVKKIEILKNDLEVFCIEYENITGGVLVVQRNKIEQLLDNQHFITLGEDKKGDLINLINKINPDYIHLEEIPEYFLPSDISDLIYTQNRKYKIFETSHDSSFDPDNKKVYFPDAFFFVSNWQMEQYENINVPKQPEYLVLTKNIVLEKVKIGSKIVLNNIFFDSNKATLRKESNLEIEKLLNLMKEYPELTFEVAGHTDNKGNDATNLQLSQMRAQAVVNAFVKKGINVKYLVAKGYGETMPIATNTLPNGESNKKGMQQNRRVEIKIIEPK